MPKRAPRNRQKGQIGESAALQAFQRLGWGPIGTGAHDTGSDLFVQLRDRDLTELGLLLGVQVKNEDKYFEQRTRAKALDSDPAGWWYRAKAADAQYWLDHSVAHVLVLFDDEREELWWGHVSPESVVFLQRGAKVWVPARPLNEESREDLLAVASAARSAGSWQGTIWDDLSRIPPAIRMRAAMLTPRIVAPHLNKKIEKLSPPEAIAMILQGHLDELGHREHKSAVPSADERAASGVGWRLFDAILNFVQSGDTSSSKCLITDPDATAQEALAAAIANAAFHAELGEYSEALQSLEMIDGPSLADPIDLAWWRLAKVRCLIELGSIELATREALDVAAIGQLYAHDPGAVTLSAGAFNSLFLINPWEGSSLVDMIRSNDSAPRWWRAQQRSWALSDLLEEAFQLKVAGKEKRAPYRDTWLRLRGLLLNAGFSGDHRSWRGAARDMAVIDFMGPSVASASDYATVLRDLRLAGDKKTLDSAIEYLKLHGPVGALTTAAAAIDLSTSTTTSRMLDLLVVQRSADLMTEEVSNRHAKVCLENVRGWGRDASSRSTESGHDVDEMVTALRRFMDTQDQAFRDRVRAVLLDLPPVNDHLIARSLARLAASVPVGEWSADDLGEIRQRAGEPPQKHSDVSDFGDHWELAVRWLGILAARGEEKYARWAHEGAVELSHRELSAVNYLEELSPEDLKKMRLNLVAQLDTRFRESKNGVAKFGASNPAVLLLRINRILGDADHWDSIVAVLNGESNEWDLDELLREIPKSADGLDSQLRGRLVAAIEAVIQRPEQSHWSMMGVDIRRRARVARMALVSPFVSEVELMDRMCGDADSRVSLCSWIGAEGLDGHAHLLGSLAGDESAKVRAAAAAASVEWVLRGDAPPIVELILKRATDDLGVAVTYGLMRAIPHREDLGPVRWILDLLSKSPSRAVRDRAEHLLEDPSVCRCNS